MIRYAPVETVMACWPARPRQATRSGGIVGPNRPLLHLSLLLLPSVAVSLAVGWFVVTPALPAAAQSGGRYYPETGHSIDSRFLGYFDRHGGPEVFGFPITEAFQDPETGQEIQYTENARLELAPGAAAEPPVRMAPLGELMGGWQLPSLESSQERSGCVYFSDSGHSTCFAFLEFVKAHGGTEFFGLPISEFNIEGERIVQYFQFFRLDWYPDAPSGSQVRVGALGRDHFRQAGYDPDLLKPVDSGNSGDYRITDIRPSASVRQPTLGAGATQEVYLLLQDQNGLPVQGAVALLVVHQPQKDRYFLMPRTDVQGLSRRTLELDPDIPPATVNFEIWVVTSGMQAVARDSFAIR